MLVRSASTPILGALHPSGCHSPAVSVSSPAVHFPESPAAAYYPPTISCHLSGGGSDHERLRGNGAGGMRRTSSEGNLASLAGRADDLRLLPPSGKCAPPRARPAPLETIQSFTNRDASTDEEEEEDEDAYAEDRELSFGQFNFLGSSTYSQEHPLFLARGLGIDRLGSGLLSVDGGVGEGGIGGGGGGGSHLVTSGGNGGNRSGIEMHYKKMLEEDPCNGLFLRNYAQFLYQVKGDYRRAEEYYSRSILADPDDGELLSEYAKLVWDVHGDEERASSYFEQAARVSPQNSHVLAAHAAFLWDTDGPEDCSSDALGYAGFAPARSSLASATT